MYVQCLAMPTHSCSLFLIQCQCKLSLLQVGLSNVFEYMSEEDAEATFTLLANSISSGGRVAFWNLFNHRLPSQLLLRGGKMTYLEELSKQLHHMDRLFFYSAFRVVLIN